MTRAKRLAALRNAWGRPSTRARNVPTIAEYHHLRREASASLDGRTWADLDLDAVFASVDHTTSTLGEQALYHRLRTAPSAPHPDAFEVLVDRMSRDVDARERAQLSLSGLQDAAGYDLWWLAQPGAVDSAAWHALFPVLAFASLLSIALLFVWGGALIFVIGLAMINLIMRGVTARRVGGVLAAFRQLGPLMWVAQRVAFLDSPQTDAITGALGVHLPDLQRLTRIASWVSRDPQVSGDLIASAFEYLNLLFLLDANALYFASRELRARGPALLAVIGAVGDVDAAIAVASFRAGNGGWTRPTFTAGQEPLEIVGMRHPLVPDCVPNSVEFAPPRGVLVTGSNMSGKSTFLRTLGVTAVLAQTIGTCLAESYRAPIYRVQSCIGRADDLLAGKSYYQAEVERVLSLVDASREPDPHLFLFDELFRGTNAIERIAAAEAVLAELLRAPDDRPSVNVVVAATHDGELVEFLRSSYAPYHFTDSIQANQLVFDYRLTAGPATTRNAIALLRLNGAPERVVARALARAAAIDALRRG